MKSIVCFLILVGAAIGIADPSKAGIRGKLTVHVTAGSPLIT